MAENQGPIDLTKTGAEPTGVPKPTGAVGAEAPWIEGLQKQPGELEPSLRKPYPAEPPKPSWREQLFHQVRQGFLGPDYTVQYDDEGKRQTIPRERKPGEAWGHLLAGALVGLAAGAQQHGPHAGMKAFAAGGEAGVKLAEKQKEKKEEVAVQDQTAKLRAATIHHQNLAALKAAQDLGYEKDKHPFDVTKMRQDAEESAMRLKKEAKSMGLVNERTFTGFDDPNIVKEFGSIEAAAKAAAHPDGKHFVVALPDGSVRVYDRTFGPDTPNTALFDLKQPVTNAETGQEELRTIHTFQPGESTIEQQMAAYHADVEWARGKTKFNAEIAKANADALEKTSRADMNKHLADLAGGAGGIDSLSPEMETAVAALPPKTQEWVRKLSPLNITSTMALASGDLNPTGLPTRINQKTGQLDRRTLESYALRLNPYYKSNFFQVKAKADTEFGPGGKSGIAINSFNQFLAHAGEAQEVINEWKTTGSPLLNKPLNELRSKYLGQPGVGKLLTALEAPMNEYFAFLKNNMALKEEEVATMKSMLNTTLNPEQLTTNLHEMARQAIVRMRDLNRQYYTQTYHNWPNMIYPETADAVKTLGLEKDVAGFTTGGVFGGGFRGVQPPAAPTMPGGEWPAKPKMVRNPKTGVMEPSLTTPETKPSIVTGAVDLTKTPPTSHVVSMKAAKQNYPNVPEATIRKWAKDNGYTVGP